jgi:hypothetical protein
MAVLTADELVSLRRKLAHLAEATGLPIDYVKSEVNDAFQAIEDWWELPATKADISNAIDASTAFSFTNEQKKKIGKFWLELKAGKE